MSGRLVILRHKKWNVWNRENIEKVKKDERLHQEALKEQNEKERKLNSEYLREQFLIKNDDNEITTSLMTRNQNIDDNDEYKKEKEEKELLQKRRDGNAPWALGDGSLEYKKISPWYMEKSHNLNQIKRRNDGKILTSDEIQAALDRDKKRKRTEDPMSNYLYSPAESKDNNEDIQQQNQLILHPPPTSSLQESINSSMLPGMSGMNSFVLGNLITNQHENSEKKHKNKKRKHIKKDKKSKKEKKKKRKNSDKRRNNDDEVSSISSSSSEDEDKDEEESHQSSYKHALSRNEIEILRKKRNQREENESKREKSLLNNM